LPHHRVMNQSPSMWKKQGISCEHGSSVQVLRDPVEAVTGANAVYTDVWASMGQEAEHEERLKIFKTYQVNPELMSHADKNAIFLHCLPAHRGEEVVDEVATALSLPFSMKQKTDCMHIKPFWPC